MARGRKPVADIITQANPTPEQRARFTFSPYQTFNPHGATVTAIRRKTENGIVHETKVHTHLACRKDPPYKRLKGLSSETIDILEWYEDRIGLARKGLMVDSLARGAGGKGHTPTEAAIIARQDVDKARTIIWLKTPQSLPIFDAVMEHEATFEQLANGSGSRKQRFCNAFRQAARYLVAGIAELRP